MARKYTPSDRSKTTAKRDKEDKSCKVGRNTDPKADMPHGAPRKWNRGKGK